jgi:hypothetical protein
VNFSDSYGPEEPVDVAGRSRVHRFRAAWSTGLADATFRWVTAALVVLVGFAIFLLFRRRPRSLNATGLHDTRVVVIVSLVAALFGYVLYALHVSRDVEHGRRTKAYAASGGSIKDQLYLESSAMAEYALKSGNLSSGMPRGIDLAFLDEAQKQFDTKPRWIAWNNYEEEAQADLVGELAAVHQNLTRIVAPASPQTLALIAYEKDKRRAFPWLGNIRLVRMMVGLAILLTPAFLSLAVSIGTRLDKDGLFSGNSGDKLQTAVYLVVGAGLGSAFAALSKAFNYIGNLSYDDKYESSYWIRFVQGIIAGVVLSIVIAQAFFVDNTVPTQTSSDLRGFRITVPLLAFVGGFSSDLVYRILNRIIEAIETLISGSVQQRTDAQDQQIRAQYRVKELESRKVEISKLIQLKEALPQDEERLHSRVDELLSLLMGGDLDRPATHPKRRRARAKRRLPEQNC